MKSNHLNMIDAGQSLHDRCNAPRREHERIAPGEDHFPDVRTRGDIGESGVQRLARQRFGPSWPYHLAAETEAAIDRAGVGDLQEHAIRIAVHDPFHRTVRLIPDGVGRLNRQHVQFGRVGRELPGDRIVRIVGVDQCGQGWRDRHRVLRRHAL